MDHAKPPAHREVDESAEEYSDLASVHSANEAKHRRKHKRGGRKTSYEKPTAEETAGLLGPEDEQSNEDHGQEEDNTCQDCSRKPKPEKIERQPRRRIQEPFETGIRAFNVRKAAGSRRPVGVRATSEKKSNRKPATAPVPTLKREVSSKSDAGYETQSEGSTSKRAEEDEAPEDPEEEPAGKPMSIRLDLDLMIEVFLKAKIKGAVTVTFLE